MNNGVHCNPSSMAYHDYLVVVSNRINVVMKWVQRIHPGVYMTIFTIDVKASVIEEVQLMAYSNCILYLIGVVVLFCFPYRSKVRAVVLIVVLMTMAHLSYLFPFVISISDDIGSGNPWLSLAAPFVMAVSFIILISLTYIAMR